MTFLSSAALVAWLPVPGLFRVAAVIAIGAYAIAVMRSSAIRSAPHAIVGVELGADRTVRLTERGGKCFDGVVQPDSYVGVLVTTLVVRREGKRRLCTVAILPDMLPADDFRRLRLLLRLGRRAATSVQS